MTDEQRVKEVWPDATLMQGFAVQPDKTRRWMWCAASSLAFLKRRGRGIRRVTNIGGWKFSETEAWADAAHQLTQSQQKSRQDGGAEE